MKPLARSRTACEEAWTLLPGVELQPQPDGTLVRAAHLRDAVALAEQVWRADVTGAGRVRWPRYFSATAPARHLYTRVRIQAGIARRTDAGRVVVHLVWAGADPSGQYREGRTARVLLARTDHGWEPVR